MPHPHFNYVQQKDSNNAMKSLEKDLPIEEIGVLAELESWRKEVNRPVYHLHKWWATRLGSVFRAIVLAGSAVIVWGGRG